VLDDEGTSSLPGGTPGGRPEGDGISSPWWGLARDPIAVSAALVFAVLVAVYAVPLVGDSTLERLTNRYGSFLFQGIALAALIWGSRRLVSTAERWLWWWLAAAVSVYAASRLLWLAVGTDTSSGIALMVDVLYSAGYLLLIAGLERAPHRKVDDFQGLAPSYNVTAAFVFAAALVSYFIVVPFFLGRQTYESMVPSMLLFLTFDVIIVVRMAQFAVEARSNRWRWLYGGLLVAGLAWLGGDLLETLSWAGLRGADGRRIADLIFFVPYAAIAITARVRDLPLSEVEERPYSEETVRLPREQLVLFVLLYPSIHLAGYRFLGFDPAIRPPRDALVLMFLAVLGSLALGQYRQLAKGASWLAAEATRRGEVLEEREKLIRALTEGQEAQKARRVSEENFERIFRSSPDSMLITTMAEGRYIEVNEGFEHTTGYSRDEVLGLTTIETETWMSDWDRTVFVEALQRDGKVRNMEFELRRRSGKRLVALLSAEPMKVDGQPCILTVVRDITEAKQAEEALRASEERFVKAFRASPDAIVISTVEEGVFVEVNPGFELLSGVPRQEALGRSSTELNFWVYPEERALFARIMEEQGQVRNMEAEVFRRNGEQITCLISAEMIELEGARRILSVIRDISEAKRAQEALRASEQRFARAFLSNPDPAALTALKGGRFIEVNDAFCEAAGWSRGEMLGRDGRELGIWSDEKAREIADRIVAGEPVRDVEVDFRSRDGELRNMVASSELLEIDGEQCLLTVARDVTEKRVLERQLLRAQRMDSIGTLAGGIAHDLNNVLSPILMSVQLLKRESLSDQGAKLLDILEANTRRGAEMIRQVLSFARGVEGERVELQPKHLVRELQSIVRDTFPKTIVSTFGVPKGLWTVEGDATQIHQVLLNLCLNARDAMPDGGRLVVELSNHQVDEEFCRTQLDAKPGDYVAFSVSDDGAGIEPAIRDKIFEPFFTTKSVGEGTGIGLSSVAAIVKGHDGFVTLYSELDQGSRFQVFIPAIVVTGAPHVMRPSGDLPIGRGQLVLLVDDEPGVREVASRTLETFGYRVRSEAGGREALAFFDDHGDEVDILLVDMMMPGLDGPGTINAIRERRSDLPIIASSGLSSREDVDELHVQGFLAKPFTAEELLETVHVVLKEAAGE